MAGAFAIAVEGATLAGETKGEGTPLAFVHGMAGEMHDWDRLWAELPAGLPLLRYDLRGFGRSRAEDGVAFSHADDLAALFDALGIDRAPVVGLSMGGGIALNFALNHPGRVSRLILVSPAMVGWEWSPEWKAQWRAVSAAARAGDLPAARALWLDHPMFARVLASGAADDFRNAIAAYHGRQWVQDDQRRELPDIERLHDLAVPTLLLTGAEDVPDMRLIAEVIAASAPEVTRIDFPESGHLLHLEHPREVAEAIAQFLG